MLKLVILIALIGAISAQIDNTCLGCICKVESNCNVNIGCKFDVYSDSCGPYQIKEAYWVIFYLNFRLRKINFDILFKRSTAADQVEHGELALMTRLALIPVSEIIWPDMALIVLVVEPQLVKTMLGNYYYKHRFFEGSLCINL